MVATYGSQIVPERTAGDSFAGVRVRMGLHQPPHVVGGIGESSARGRGELSAPTLVLAVP